MRGNTSSQIWLILKTGFLICECFGQKLHTAREVHQFDHDLDELRSWMSEKEVALDSEDQENDLLSVQALIRQHEGMEVK